MLFVKRVKKVGMIDVIDLQNKIKLHHQGYSPAMRRVENRDPVILTFLLLQLQIVTLKMFRNYFTFPQTGHAMVSMLNNLPNKIICMNFPRSHCPTFNSKVEHVFLISTSSLEDVKLFFGCT